MKRIVLMPITALLIFLLTSCSGGAVTPGNTDEVYEKCDSVESLCEQIGLDMQVPSTAKSIECAVINNTIGEITFSFNSVIYVYRGSKLEKGVQLHKKAYNESSCRDVPLGERASLEFYNSDEGGCIAQWYLNGTNYSVTAQKAVSDDALTELCDLLIP